MSNEETRAVLLRAAEILEPKGAWTQGAYRRDAKGNGVGRWGQIASRCAEEAITVASEQITPDDYEANVYESAIHVMNAWIAHHGLDGHDVALWNDRDVRTQAEVVQALRDAAAAVPS